MKTAMLLAILGVVLALAASMAELVAPAGSRAGRR
jgi:hypothetical protein